MVFDWIVHRIRRSLEPEGVDPASLPHIGVLDIFGFESFAENGLEQLLINYGTPPPSSSVFLDNLQQMNRFSCHSTNLCSKLNRSCISTKE
jgi:hypothetical protein